MQFLKAKVTGPLSFISCGHFISDGDWIHSKRTIDSFEIIIGIKGTAFIKQDDEKYELIPGKVLLLLPGHIHEGYSISSGQVSFFWVHFHIKDVYNILEEKDAYKEIYPLMLDPFTNRLHESVIIPTFSTLENKERINILFSQLLHTSSAKYYTSFAVDYLITLLLIEISQQIIKDSFKLMDNSLNNNSKFISILEWIRINIHKDISVDELAKRFNFNSDYLCRLFKKRLGVSVIKYINGMKVSEAKQLLCQSDRTIKEIAYSLGFMDEKYFMKLFRQYENITPSEFRNAYYLTHLNNK